ncbi:hypothetical protein ABTX77_35830 [Streptomyces sp. NPDC097704]|uniref:RICIN domain-containing protein n=1 Tax=Streptomyces sp. NPDC097704 TaxID=3157101 RepID=UPI003332D7E0
MSVLLTSAHRRQTVTIGQPVQARRACSSRFCAAFMAGPNAATDTDAEQQWHLTRKTAGPPVAVSSVRNRFSGLCLSVEGAKVANNVPVTHYPCSDRQGLFPDQF